MLKSMTGFGTGIAENTAYRATVEIKSVNQRYLDISLRLPDGFSSLEKGLLEIIKAKAARGKITAIFTLAAKNCMQPTIQINKALAVAYQNALNEISDLLHLARPEDSCEIAHYPGVLTQGNEQNPQEAAAVCTEALRNALLDFCTMREAEGLAIQKDFVVRLMSIQQIVQKLETLSPVRQQAYQAHLEETVRLLLDNKQIDQNRIIEETAIYADKADYTEEVVRLASHIKQFQKIIETAAEPVGRKLDFLLQEMNRETNTIASKTNFLETVDLTITLKSEIEKIREQLQNLE